MTGTDVEAVIIRELQKLASGSVGIKADTNIVRELNLPSLDVMELVMALEDEYDISIPLDRIADVETVHELAELVRSLNKKADV
ncbi:phosphopantetheine-binding protein [Sulfitobacter sp.]|uniref:acyl carrier protein n=1 Tax=Sulfitobacter sp. TaxID=1903071 RepID=UPI0032983172